MQWIKEGELVDSVDDLKSSSSTRGISMPNFDVLDARIASALNKIIHNSHFQMKNQSGGTKGPEAGPSHSPKSGKGSMQYGELRSYRGSRLVKFFLWIFINLKDTLQDRGVIVQRRLQPRLL